VLGEVENVLCRPIILIELDIDDRAGRPRYSLVVLVEFVDESIQAGLELGDVLDGGILEGVDALFPVTDDTDVFVSASRSASLNWISLES